MKQEVHGIEPIWYLGSLQNDDSIESKQDQKWLQKVEKIVMNELPWDRQAADNYSRGS